MKKRKGLKIFLGIIGGLLAAVILFVAGFLIFGSATTLKVQDRAPVEISGDVSAAVSIDEPVTLMTWNVGYGALDEREDCYWDGGVGVYGESAEVVQENIDAIKAEIRSTNPDVLFVQELDVNSKRSYYIDELGSFRDDFGSAYNSTFAPNFKAGCVPLPITSPTGRVEAGISTFSKYSVSDAERIQLPIPFSYPMNLFNLKRCLLINRIPIENSDKELVLINLHLEAYDDGDGKAKQLAMLMDILQEEYDKGNYVIAGGDFNQTFSTADYAKYPDLGIWDCPVIDAESYPDFSFVMDDATPTCRSLCKPYSDADKTDFQYYMIDGFVVSGNVTINSLETLDKGFKNTDHNPVVMSIALNK